MHGTNLVMSISGHWARNGISIVVDHQNSHDSDSDFLAGRAPFPIPGNNAHGDADQLWDAFHEEPLPALGPAAG